MRNLWTRALGLVVALMLLAASAPRADAGTPVIERDREREIIGLFAPYKLGNEVAPGWRLWNIKVDKSDLQVGLKGPGERWVRLTLTHPSLSTGDAQVSPSFALLRRTPSDDPNARQAVDRLLVAVKKNDSGGIYTKLKSTVLLTTEERFGGMFDGVLFTLILLALLLTLAVRLLRDEPRWMSWALLGIVVFGGGVRLAIAPDVAMGALPYSRLSLLTHAVFEGPLLGLTNRVLGGHVYLTSVISATTLFYAALTPLALFVCGRYLIRDTRVALGGAALMAALPMHIRFSASESPFVPSLVLALTCLSLLYVLFTERSRAWRVAALLLLPYFALMLLRLRPLNWLYALPLAAAVVWLLPARVSRWLRVAFAVCLVVGTGLYAVDIFAPAHQSAIEQDAAKWHWINHGLRVLIDPTRNVLLNPRITPPPFLVLAFAGAVLMWRGGRRRELFVLLGWMGAFYATLYGFGTNPTMQAHYSLPQSLGFVLLGAFALPSLYRWNRKLCTLFGVFVLLVPLVYLPFERDTDFNDLREYRFVREARSQIPPGCVVLEYTGPARIAARARFRRVGRMLRGGKVRSRFSSRVVADLPTGELPPAVVALKENPPACLVYYEGIPCWSDKKQLQPIAPVCVKLRQAFRLEPLRSTTFRSRPYDLNLSRGFDPTRTHLTLSVYRLTVAPRRAHPRGSSSARP